MPQLAFPFTTRVKQLTQHPNDSGSTATLSSMTSAATRLHFTEDTESYMQPPPMPSNNSANSNGARSTERPGALARMWTFRKRASTTTLIEESSFKNTDEPIGIVDTTPRLIALRARMAEEDIDYFIIPSEDAHLSEYVAESDKRLHWISNFTGSAGTAIITKRSAYLFVDSRYWLQAEQELDKNWIVHKTGTPEIKDWLEWAITCPRGSKIGIDSRMISHERATKLYKGLYDRGSKLVHPRQNLVDLVWENRPKMPKDLVYCQPGEFTGKDIKEKLSEIRKWIRKQNAALGRGKGGLTRPASTTNGPGVGPAGLKRSESSASNKPVDPTAVVIHSSPRNDGASPGPAGPEKIVAVFVSDLGSIAYALNLRGSDIPFNPVFTAYLLVGVDGKTVLFIDGEKVPEEVKGYLDENGVSVREYSEVWSFLRAKQWGEGKVIITPNTPYAASLIIGSRQYVVLPSYIEEVKAVKNEVEIEGMRSAYIRDGVAMVRWFAWLEHKIGQGYKITEWEASEKLNSFRENEPKEEGAPAMYAGLAYKTIAATGANAALPHYNPAMNASQTITKNGPFLVDSGGQYRDGTCKTIRTVHFGYPTVEQAEVFTRVLQGHIAIDTAIFPAGTTGIQLDILARKPLWRDGQDCLHDTGHGVGSFLSIHEGPHSFSSATPLQPGHVIANEPGFYKDGEFGVRIGSVLLVREFVERKRQREGDRFYGFVRLTQVPIQMKMVRPSLLSMEERQWVIDHNASVRRELEPYLRDDREALRWLRQAERVVGNEGSTGRTIEWD